MKFANYTFRARGVNNLGDNMQLIAIDKIYEAMGVPACDIVYIDKNDLASYKGEYVIMPVTMPLVDYTEGGICGRFSDHIIPVFLGLTLAQDMLLPEEVEYYRHYEPIGCRDERTLVTLRSYEIQSYLHGCITVTFPRRKAEGKSFDKVFIVDVPDELLPYIPEQYKKNADYRSHLHTGLTDNPKEIMQQYYDDYKNAAKLVITSLLHCSVPCMAAGIPVIMAKTAISYRFAWLEKLLPLYDLEDFPNIDWNPAPIEYEEHKARVLHLSMDRLWEVFNKYQSIYDLSWFYENREKKEYIVDAFMTIKKFIDKHFTSTETEYPYAIWGLTQMSTLTVQYISRQYPNAKLMHVYDTFRKVKFEGISSENPKNIRNHPEEIVFVTTNGAQSAAEELFEEMKKPSDTYVFLEVIR